jgi:hypothetical protein
MTEDAREDLQETEYPDKTGRSWAYTTYRDQGYWQWMPSPTSPKLPTAEERGTYSSRDEAEEAARRWIDQQES